MMKLIITVLTIFIHSLAVASRETHFLNDWQTPCFNGECEYHADHGSVRIAGDVNAISDITHAGGWHIFECDPNALDQEIRLICMDPSLCEHIHGGAGAVGTLVRLPEECGKAAFSHVEKLWDHEDQTLPPDVAKKLLKRGQVMSTMKNKGNKVQGAKLSSTPQVDDQKHGAVEFWIQGSTIPGFKNTVSHTPPNRRSRLQKAPPTDSKVNAKAFVEKAFATFSKNKKTTIPHIAIKKSVPLAKLSVNCPQGKALNGMPIPAFTGEVSSSLDVDIQADIGLGIAAQGTLVPPKVNAVGVYASVDGGIEGALMLKASASGTVTAGPFDLYSMGIPGLDFPGILSLGPRFKVQAKAVGEVSGGLQLKVAVSHQFDQAKLFYPPTGNYKSSSSSSGQGKALDFSATLSVNGKVGVTGHIIPRLELGLSALGGAGKADVYLELDASTGLSVSVEASKTFSTANRVDKKGDKAPGTPGKALPLKPQLDHTEAMAPKMKAAADRPSTSTSSRKGKRAASSGSASGCLDVTPGVDVGIGAEGNFFGLIGTAKRLSLWKKDFTLLHKCFGNGGAAAAPTGKTKRTQSSLMKRKDLGCPVGLNIGPAFIRLI